MEFFIDLVDPVYPGSVCVSVSPLAKRASLSAWSSGLSNCRVAISRHCGKHVFIVSPDSFVGLLKMLFVRLVGNGPAGESLSMCIGACVNLQAQGSSVPLRLFADSEMMQYSLRQPLIFLISHSKLAD
jgi:hypothetical protein